jgi:hypothetical protein
VENQELRKRYEALYYRVYGGKPNNGLIAYFFVSVASYYFDKNKLVNWVELAREIWAARYKAPNQNPCKHKLELPCLTKQVQGMVDEVAFFINSNPSVQSEASSSTSPKVQVTSSILTLAELETSRGKARYAQHEVATAQQEVSFLYNH